MLKNIAKIILPIIVLIVAGLCGAPYLINWNDYKNALAQKVKDATGYELRIDTLSASVFPLPKLTATGITLGNNASQENALAASGLEAEISPLPLLLGSIQISGILIKDVGFTIHSFEDEKTSGGGADTVEKVLDVLGVHRISLQNARITLISGNRAKPVIREVTLTRAELEAGSASGPFSISGQVESGDARVPMALNASIGDMAGGKPAKLTFAVTAGLSLMELNGTIRKEGGRVLAEASFLAKIDQSARELVERSSLYRSRFSRIISSMFSQQPTEIKGDFYISEQGAGLNNVSFSSESTKGTGKVSVLLDKLRNIDIQLVFDAVDIDAVLASELTYASKEKLRRATGTEEKAAQNVPIENSFAGDMNFLIDIMAKEIRFKEHALQNVNLKMGVAQGNALIRALNIQGMPGNTTLAWNELPLSEQNADGRQEALGKISLTGDRMDSFANWIGGKNILPDTPAFKAFSLNADIASEALQVRVPRIELVSGPVIVIGQAEINRSEDVRINAAFHINQLMLDEYLSKVTEGSGPRLNAERKVLVSLSGLELLLDNLSASVEIDNVQYHANDYIDCSGLIEITPDSINLLNIAVASSPFGKISGEIRVPVEVLKPHPQINATIEKFDTGFFSESGGEEKREAPSSAPNEKWSEKPFNFRAVEMLEKGKARIIIGTFQHDNIMLKNVSFSMELADNKLMIPDLKTHVFDSELLVTEGVLTFGDERPTMRFAFDIANTDLKQALETLVGYTLITGRGSITGSVAMSGKNISEWIDSMEGSARIYARAVSIKGMDFDLLGKKMGALKELEDIRYWSHRALTTGKTYVDFLTASIAVRRGKLFFENISATQARIVNYTIELIADLARWTLEGKINLSVRTNEQKSIPIPVAITLAGDLSNPYVTWDKSLYEQYWEQKYFRY